MKNIFIKIASIIVGLITVFTGFWSMNQPYLTLLSLSWVYVTLILTYGVISIITYTIDFSKDYRYATASLVMGIVEVLLAMLLISNVEMVAVSLPLIITMWIMVRGLLALFLAIESRHIIGSIWKMLVVLALLMIVVGYGSFVNPWVTSVGISLFVGIQMIVVGIQMIASTFLELE